MLELLVPKLKKPKISENSGEEKATPL